ncbi:hypothetical protein PCANC_06478 [Puccinia coronata f. sp. avenae]|uniref:Uncharacterized protein n=1 Tax=Puccinia coronata f. sp. avenae TaxID=200324 RepID=A0A2N5VVW2_9BASI|nr:hypothetical protein PCANC_06478 [Puccinia coronata f. sp. avenae]
MAPDHDQKGRNAGASLTLGCGVGAPVLLTASFVAPASGRVTGADFLANEGSRGPRKPPSLPEGGSGGFAAACATQRRSSHQGGRGASDSAYTAPQPSRTCVKLVFLIRGRRLQRRAM